MEKSESSSFSFNNAFSMLLIVLLIGVLACIISALVFGLLPPQGRTGFVVPQVETVQVLGQEMVHIEHKGGDTFLLNVSSSSPFSVIGLAIETKNGTEKVRIIPSVKKYSFAPGDSLYIFHSRNGYFVSDAKSNMSNPGTFVNGTYYLVITDETHKTLIMRLGPY
jgi:hypothetical protein